MRSRWMRVVMSSLATTILLATVAATAPLAAQPGYFELHMVKLDVSATSPNAGRDMGSVSVQQNTGVFGGAILADVTGVRASGDNVARNLCAARDLDASNAATFIPGLLPGTTNLCTGVLAIGKDRGTHPTYYIDFIGSNFCPPPPAVPTMGMDETPAQEIGGFFPTPQPNGTAAWIDPLTQGIGGASYQITTAHGRPYDMDVGIGLTTFASATQLESWLFTAEDNTVLGQHAIVATYLSPIAALCAPLAPAVQIPVAMPPGWVVRDLAVTSSPASPTGNVVWIQFLDTSTPANPIAHVVPFTLGFNGAGSTFGTADPPGNPYGIPPGGLALGTLFGFPVGAMINMWQARNPAGLGTYGDVGISLQNRANPFGAPGHFAILRAAPAAPAAIAVPGAGGGPVTHLCAQAATGGPGVELRQPTGSAFGPGWYLVKPIAPGIWCMGAIDRNGVVAHVAGVGPVGAVYNVFYPFGTVPAGVHLAHPGDIFRPAVLPATSHNFVCMPYLTGGGDFFQIAQANANALYTAAGGVPFVIAPNYGAPPAFPVQHGRLGMSWSGFNLFRCRTNYWAENALYSTVTLTGKGW